ncbi:hypothetical protein N7539_008830 [Penicillium diatomitis]|uniref:Uncharacterized protein n=1 Tax=Penicillium diatomitis TaxID=2819901 RepID=A0A9W9WRE8_9EURO|nr:uncharacterized protein N7539_008830 [Penicillium diatomitis]KAJ5471887.1 hypothetical protein N7539_008830 [Penicillium diatomitis]
MSGKFSVFIGSKCDHISLKRSSYNHDKKKNFRLDKGATISDKQQEIILQANKDAENAEVKKEAQKNSHRILVKCVIDPNNVDAEKAKMDLEASFKENN